jgi:hypothetical protein
MFDGGSLCLSSGAFAPIGILGPRAVDCFAASRRPGTGTGCRQSKTGEVCSGVPDLVSLKKVNDFLILRDRGARIALKALGGEVVAGPELAVIDRNQYAKKLGLPLPAFNQKVHY